MGKNPEIILIDFDGVISKNAVSIAMNAMYNFMQDFNPIPFESFKNLFKEVVCFPFVDTVTFIWKSFGIEHKLKDLFMYLKNIDSYDNVQLMVEKDFYEFTQFCHDRNIQYRIFSSADKSTGRIQNVLQKIGENKYYCLGNNSKADPKTFERAANDFNIDLNRILYIDDSPVALRTGKLKGLTTAMMLNDVFGLEDYEVFKNFIDYKVESFQEISHIINTAFCTN